VSDKWKQVSLGRLTDPDSPITYGVVKPGAEGDVLFVRGGDLVDGRVLSHQLRTITQEISDQYNRTLLRGGELLMCLVGQPGQVAIAPAELAGANIARQVGLIRLVKGVNAVFLRYFFQSPEGQEKLGTQTGGSVQQVINLGDLREVEVPVPSLQEQRRIVAILDEAFANIAIARANAEKNLQNARELFGSELEHALSQRRNGAQWREVDKSLSELCELIVDCEHKTAPTQEHGIPSIRTPNIGKGKLLLEGVYRVSEKTYREWTRRAEPRAGDLILAREAPAGNVGVVPENLPLCLGQRTVLIRPRSDILDSEFLAMMLLRPGMQRKLLATSRGATVQHVNMKDIRALMLEEIPSVLEQKAVVARINAVASHAENLAEIYQNKLAALDELKQSLLHQAFAGKL
jgi:type I restriction enzyme S subunit